MTDAQPTPPYETDYRGRIRAELSRRQRVNPRYSMRAFACSIGLSPAFVSKLLRGTKDLSPRSAVGVAERFGYSPREIAQFCRLVQIETAKSPELRAALEQPLDGAVAESVEQTLSLDAFQVIADWYHYAILHLSDTRGFRPEAEYIASRLGIPALDASQGVARLVRLGLLKSARGILRRSGTVLSTPTDQPNRALRHFHLQMIEKAKEALESQPVEERDITGITLSISEDKIELAKKELRLFRRRMSRLLETGKPTQVYQLNLQFFRLTR